MVSRLTATRGRLGVNRRFSAVNRTVHTLAAEGGGGGYIGRGGGGGLKGRGIWLGVSGHKACRTVDRPETPRWRSRAGDAAVPVCV